MCLTFRMIKILIALIFSINSMPGPGYACCTSPLQKNYYLRGLATINSKTASSGLKSSLHPHLARERKLLEAGNILNLPLNKEKISDIGQVSRLLDALAAGLKKGGYSPQRTGADFADVKSCVTFTSGELQLACFEVDLGMMDFIYHWSTVEPLPDKQYIFSIVKKWKSFGFTRSTVIGHGILRYYKDRPGETGFRFAIHGGEFAEKGHDFRKEGHGRKALEMMMAMCARENIFSRPIDRFSYIVLESDKREENRAEFEKMKRLLKEAGYDDELRYKIKEKSSSSGEELQGLIQEAKLLKEQADGIISNAVRRGEYSREIAETALGKYKQAYSIYLRLLGAYRGTLPLDAREDMQEVDAVVNDYGLNEFSFYLDHVKGKEMPEEDAEAKARRREAAEKTIREREEKIEAMKKEAEEKKRQEEIDHIIREIDFLINGINSRHSHDEMGYLDYYVRRFDELDPRLPEDKSQQARFDQALETARQRIRQAIADEEARQQRAKEEKARKSQEEWARRQQELIGSIKRQVGDLVERLNSPGLSILEAETIRHQFLAINKRILPADEQKEQNERFVSAYQPAMKRAEEAAKTEDPIPAIEYRLSGYMDMILRRHIEKSTDITTDGELAPLLRRVQKLPAVPHGGKGSPTDNIAEETDYIYELFRLYILVGRTYDFRFPAKTQGNEEKRLRFTFALHPLRNKINGLHLGAESLKQDWDEYHQLSPEGFIQFLQFFEAFNGDFGFLKEAANERFRRYEKAIKGLEGQGHIPYEMAALYAVYRAFADPEEGDQRFDDFKHITSLIDKSIDRLERHVQTGKTQLLEDWHESLPQEPVMAEGRYLDNAAEYVAYLSDLSDFTSTLDKRKVSVASENTKGKKGFSHVFHDINNDIAKLQLFQVIQREGEAALDAKTISDLKENIDKFKDGLYVLQAAAKGDFKRYRPHEKGTDADPVLYCAADAFFFHMALHKWPGADLVFAKFKEIVTRLEKAIDAIEQNLNRAIAEKMKDDILPDPLEMRLIDSSA